MQLNRELEGPGALSKGSYDFAFSFRSVDLETDSYVGIAFDVTFSVNCSMTYDGLMKYTTRDQKFFSVRNSKKQETITSDSPLEAVKEENAIFVGNPSEKVEYMGFRDTPKPCIVELYLHQTLLNIDRDSVTGFVGIKDISFESMQKITSIRLDLIQ